VHCVISVRKPDRVAGLAVCGQTGLGYRTNVIFQGYANRILCFILRLLLTR
jgi:hypothetical protein